MFKTRSRNLAVRWAVLLLLRRLLRRGQKPTHRASKRVVLGLGVAAIVGAVAFFWCRGGKDYGRWDPAPDHGRHAHDGPPADADPVPAA